MWYLKNERLRCGMSRGWKTNTVQCLLSALIVQRIIVIYFRDMKDNLLSVYNSTTFRCVS